MSGSGVPPRGWWIRSVRLLKGREQEADRRVGQLLTSLISEADKAELDGVLAHGQFVYAVRRAREMTGLRLIDAKRLVESLRP